MTSYDPVYFYAEEGAYWRTLMVPTRYLGYATEIAAILYYCRHPVEHVAWQDSPFPPRVKIDPHINRYRDTYARRIPYNPHTDIPRRAIDLIESIEDSDRKKGAVIWGGRRLAPGTPADFIIASEKPRGLAKLNGPRGIALVTHAVWMGSIRWQSRRSPQAQNIDIRWVTDEWVES